MGISCPIVVVTCNLIARTVIESAHSRGGGQPPIYRTPPSDKRPLHSYTAMPPSTITVLSARRFPAVAAPMGNRQDGISVFTSTGFAALKTGDYESATATLKPDIAIPMADLALGKSSKPKRALRMAERTEDWVSQWFEAFGPDSTIKPSDTAVFAPLLPVPFSMQWEYLNRISEDYQHALSGLAVYDTDILPELKNYASLLPLPRLSLDEPSSPQEILTQISLGADIFLLPFLNTASDSGIALTFTFPAPIPASPSPPGSPSSADIGAAEAATTPLLPLGIDMAASTHQTSLSPLSPNCACYTCTHHHRAYVQHLLLAREMLGWTLLQIHNHQVLSNFFAGVRAALAQGEGNFAAEAAHFGAVYNAEVPQGTGTRPRARGYHFKSDAFAEKRNKPAWSNFNGVTDGGAAEEGESAVDEVARAVTQTPLVPEGNSEELDRIKFAEMANK